MEDGSINAPRRPKQSRSRQRYYKLLDAAERLLGEREPDAFGLHDLAARANVSVSSVYHFFRRKEAVFVALAERSSQLFTASSGRLANERARVRRWPDLLALDLRSACNFLDENAMLMTFLAGRGGSQAQRESVAVFHSLPSHSPEGMDSYFILPHLPDARRHFAVLSSIAQGVVITSFQQHGCITPEFREEGITASTAYARTFLPDTLARRPVEVGTSSQ